MGNLSPDEALKKARNNAYMLIRSRPRSEKEIIGRLRLKGHGDAVIEEVVSSLKRAGDIDDARFARFWVESRMHSNPAGDILLARELKEKGIAAPVIDESLEWKSRSYDEREVALRIARERFGRLKKLDRRKAAKRLYDFLARRGFAFDTIENILEELI